MIGAPRSVWLVARREYVTRVRSRPLLLGTIAVAVLLIVFILLQAYVFGQHRTVRIGLAGQAISLQQTLPQEMAALGVAVTITPLDSVGQGADQVRDGDLDVLVYGARSALHVTVDHQIDPRLRATLNSQVRQQILDAQLAQLGAKPDDVLAKVGQAQISLTQLNATDPNMSQRGVLGIVVALLIGWSVLVFAAQAARRVTDDAINGTAEALLPVLRPRRLLAGNLGGTGLIGLTHVAALGVLATIVALLSGAAAAPDSVFGALGGLLIGFVLGFGLYAGAAAALAMRPMRVLPVLGPTIAGIFVVSAILLAVAPKTTATAVISVLPPFAPLLMPAQLAAGPVVAWQVLLAVALTLVTLGGLAWFAGRVYPKSLLST
ncbi:MAG TPA: ABC transporter permease [Pseudonocardiaceae bacterium]|nr:ABC transporter permease [Pseudonocardiaceae bacterium]